MGVSKRAKSIIAGLVGVAGLGVAIIPTTAGSAPGPSGAFTGVVQPGYVTNGCLTRNSGTGATASEITVRVNPGGVGKLGTAKRIRVSFAGNILPPVVLNATNQWKYTYPAGQPVPCRRIRSVVTFQPVTNAGVAVGTKDTDTLGLSLCASPCVTKQ